jgi:hypothetical protein
MKLFVVGQILSHDFNPSVPWQFIGVFSTPEKAVAACRTEDHFYGEAGLDQDDGDIGVAWEGAVYPLANKEDPQKVGEGR